VAQKGATDIIKSLCSENSIVQLSSIEKVEHHLTTVQDGEILIVGLDFHVGFLFKKDKQNYFAHSNYINSKGVEIELLNESSAFSNSNLYVIGNLTRSREKIKKWLE